MRLEIGRLVRGFKATVIAATAVLAMAAAVPAGAQLQRMYYKEVTRGGTIYVFSTSQRFASWQSDGEMGPGAVTAKGNGPEGETVIAESPLALDLYNFKHDRPAYEAPAASSPAPPSIAAPPPPSPTPFPQVKVGAEWYLSYQDGSSGGTDFSRFVVKRGYVNLESKLSDTFSARITPDVTQDSTGDIKLRLKYVYGKFSAKDLGFITSPAVEFGLAHTPWLDFEEHINHYRLQDTMFMERNGLFNSADFGVTFLGLFGGTMPKDYQKTVSKAYPGRYGSFSLGLYNGGGYHAAEKNQNKALEARLTVRPIPDVVPGLQISYFGVRGKGNTAAEPDWNIDAAMLSYESSYLVLTGQYVEAAGNQSGSAVAADGVALDQSGWSVFAEGKLTPRWSIIGRYDDFDPNSNASGPVQKRTIGGVAYHLGGGSQVLLDYETLDKGPGTPNDTRAQLTLQVNY